MKLADKMMALRKRAGWSQEELAERMGVSRQSVSKWESAQSVPELDKILMLSDLFGVTTDYLLRDEIGEPPTPGAAAKTEPRRRVTVEEAKRYLDLRHRAAPKLGIATALCVLSPVALLALGALSERGIGISEGVAIGVGIAVLLGLIAIAVACFIACDAAAKPFAFLDREAFETEPGVSALVRERQAKLAPACTRCTIIGTILCVLSPIPLIAVGSMDCSDLICAAALCFLLVLVACATVGFVWSGTVQGAADRLLEEGDFRRQKKGRRSIKGAVNVVYWTVVTAVFLIWTWGPRGNGQPRYSWMVWAIAGVLYAAVMAVVEVIEQRIQRGDKP